MEYIDTSHFTEKQLWIVVQKLKGCSYSKIKKLYKQNANFDGTISDEAIKTCLKRSSLSLNWEKGCMCGAIPLLSEVDIFRLKEYVIDNATDECYIDVDNTVEKANFLRKERFAKARNFLLRINCYNKINELADKFKKHDAGKDWVYQHMDELEADLQTPRNIEVNRLVACTPEKISHYTDTLFPRHQEINAALRFTVDETMLQPTINKKVLVPDGFNRPQLPDNSSFQHLTAM